MAKTYLAVVTESCSVWIVNNLGFESQEWYSDLSYETATDLANQYNEFMRIIFDDPDYTAQVCTYHKIEKL